MCVGTLGLQHADSYRYIDITIATIVMGAQGVAFSDCNFAIPTRQLWYACYGCIGGMVATVIPFSIFYYEADSDL